MAAEIKEHVQYVADELEKVAENDDSMVEWFEDGLYNIRYVVGDDKDYCGIMLMVACGGPNIWVDTYLGVVRGYWWADKATAELSRRAVDAIDEFGQELFYC